MLILLLLLLIQLALVLRPFALILSANLYNLFISALSFSVLHVRWLRTWILSGEYESHDEEEKWEAKRSLLKFVAVRLPFSSDYMGYLHFFQLFVLSTIATITQSIEDQKKTYTKMNNYSINFNGSNMYDLWVIK